MTQKENELQLLKEELDYHDRQYEKPYRSTELFVEWLDDFFDSAKEGMVCDLACGEGANLAYLARKYPDIKFEGIEINQELVKRGNARKGGGQFLKEIGII